jgi:hypothetical protein
MYRVPLSGYLSPVYILVRSFVRSFVSYVAISLRGEVVSLVWFGIPYLPSSQRPVESSRRGAWPLHSGWAGLGFPVLGLGGLGQLEVGRSESTLIPYLKGRIR